MPEIRNKPPIPSKPESLRSRTPSSEALSPNNDRRVSNETVPPPLPARPSRNHEQPLPIMKVPLSIFGAKRISRNGPNYPNRLGIKRESRQVFSSCAVSGDTLVSISVNSITGWDIRSGEIIWTLSLGSDIPLCCCFSAMRVVSVGTQNGYLLFIDSIMGRQINTIRVSGKAIRDVLFQNEELWVYDETGGVSIWKSFNGIVEAEGKICSAKILEYPSILHVTQSGTLWVALDKTLEIHSRTNREVALMARFDCEMDLKIIGTGSITALTSIGEKVITGHSDGTIIIWSSALMLPEMMFKPSVHKVSSLEPSLNRFLWIGYGTGKISIVDFENMEILSTWKSHQTSIIKLCVSSYFESPINQPLISLCDSGQFHAWDSLVGDLINERILQSRQPEYSQFQDIKIRVCSWNVDSQRPPDNGEFWDEWLCIGEDPDFIVVGLQEMVDLGSKSANAKMILGSNSKNFAGISISNDDQNSSQWVDKISSRLSKAKKSYSLMVQGSMIGLFLVVFISNELRGRTRNISEEFVKTGLGGLHGNKGSLITRFLVDDTSICLMNCHLAAGQTQISARNADAATIIKTPKMPEVAGSNGSFLGGNGELVLDHENVIFFGDLNYRLNLNSRDLAIQACRDKKYQELYLQDQLHQQVERVTGHPLLEFKELLPTFPPTYKYDRGTDNFDTSEKQRLPAYCDRILLRSMDDDSRILSFQSHPSMKVSDHRPISAMLNIRVKKFDYLKKELLKLDILQSRLFELKR